MTQHKFSALTLILAIVLCPSLGHGQQTSSTAEKAQTADAALREKAFELLASLAGQLGTLQSAENRARIGSNIAESLWNHDEERARALFVQVENDIRAGLQNRDNADYSNNRHTIMVFLRLREDTCFVEINLPQIDADNTDLKVK